MAKSDLPQNDWTQSIDEDFDENFYSKEYPDAMPFYENLQHISLRERLFNHYKRFGKDGNLFKNSKEKEKVWTKNIDEDFDEKFYLEEYPETIKFYENWSHISLRERLFNHYRTFGKDCNLFKSPKEKEKVWTKNIDEDFDEKFYLEEYPESTKFYNNWRHISLRERLFNHYRTFSKIRTLFKNLKEKDGKETDHTSISKIISIKEFQFKSNKLECVCLLLSTKEIEKGLYEIFLDRIKNSTSLDPHGICFKIVTNQHIDKEILRIDSIKSMFKNVDVVNLNLPPEEDVYIKEDTIPAEVPTYGTKSGPNVMFFRALKMCKEYDTTLFLETDCFFKNDWLNKIKNFVENCNGFWISGSLYEGSAPCKASSLMMTHINGGTGLYATGHRNFQTFIESAEEFILRQIKDGVFNLAYDFGIKMFIDYNVNNSTSCAEDILAWKMINRQYLPNKFIGNFSTDVDQNLSIEDINRMYNYYIIHKKHE